MVGVVHGMKEERVLVVMVVMESQMLVVSELMTHVLYLVHCMT